MKNTFIVLGAIIVVGGGVYALAPRETLKQYFQTGDIPTQAQFESTIDSSVHMTDDRPMDDAKEYNPTKNYDAGDTVVKSDAVVKTKVLTEGQKEFTLEPKQSATFRWTPVVPKTKESVTYRLKVWQLMQGQSGAQAMAKNSPVVTKEVTDASEITVNGILTGPCRPPYLCDFVWSVEVVSNGGQSTSGTAAPASVPVKQEDGASVETDSASGGLMR